MRPWVSLNFVIRDTPGVKIQTNPLRSMSMVVLLALSVAEGPAPFLTGSEPACRSLPAASRAGLRAKDLFSVSSAFSVVKSLF
jgi:hypothetical protein